MHANAPPITAVPGMTNHLFDVATRVLSNNSLETIPGVFLEGLDNLEVM